MPSPVAATPEPIAAPVVRTPVPDPTELTSRAVDALRTELMVLFINRLDALTDLTDERFRGVKEKLEIAERLRLEQKVDTKTAVDAALAAQKESSMQQALAFTAETSKSERNISEQLTALRDTFGTAILAQTTRYEDLKERLTRIESNRIGGTEERTERRANNSAIYAIVGFVVSLLLAGMTVLAFVAASNP